MTKNEKKWAENYELLKEYIAEHRQLPDKKKVEHRSLLNWWKYRVSGNLVGISINLCKSIQKELFINDTP